jgi:hypothetical protein
MVVRTPGGKRVVAVQSTLEFQLNAVFDVKLDVFRVKAK